MENTMHYMKILGLAAVAAAALMAFVGASTASATVLCSTTTTPCNSVVHNGTKIGFSLDPGAAALLTYTSGEEIDTCDISTVTGELTSSNTASLSTLDWSGCTWTTTTIAAGKLEITGPLTGTSSGTVKSDAEIKWTISIPFFGSCVYGATAGVSLGTLTEGNPATFDLAAVVSKLSGSSITCPSTAFLNDQNGGYVVTEPANTTIAVEPS
jgi:hypothetical protein